jgi:predicted aspartyl protease
MRRRTFLAALAATPFIASNAHASTYETPLSFDPRGRPLANVSINGQGPFEMVIDTAAGGTLLNRDLIAHLALTSTRRARVQGASGAVDSALYELDAVEIAGLRRQNQYALEIPADSASSASHQGVLSARTFTGTRLTYAFAAGALRIDARRDREPLANALEVRFRQNVYPFTPVTIGGIAATALIDTGARRSVGNPALRNALGFTANDPRLREVEPIGGATAHRTDTVAADIASVAIAQNTFGALELAFADLPVFNSLEIAQRPAVILGMDVLRQLQTLTLDYSSWDVAITV